jgi:hypothetical protein
LKTANKKTIYFFQPRVVTSVGGQAKSALTPGSISSSKPSVIVVQRSSGIGGGGAMAVPAKALLTKVVFKNLKKDKNDIKMAYFGKCLQFWAIFRNLGPFMAIFMTFFYLLTY